MRPFTHVYLLQGQTYCKVGATWNVRARIKVVRTDAKHRGEHGRMELIGYWPVSDPLRVEQEVRQALRPDSGLDWYAKPLPQVLRAVRDAIRLVDGRVPRRRTMNLPGRPEPRDRASEMAEILKEIDAEIAAGRLKCIDTWPFLVKA